MCDVYERTGRVVSWCIVAGWIKMPLGTEVGLSPGDIVLDGVQLSPRKGALQTPTFQSMSGVAKRSPVSATAELL